MFNKFIADKQKALRGGDKERRPYLATACRDLNAADKWRQEILREIGKKVLEIQNAGLGEHRLRDLNDEINKLIREKGHWERQILSLGGPNYVAQSGGSDGKKEGEVAGEFGTGPSEKSRGSGYKYFGAAKRLPGVKELFEKPKQRTVRKTRHQLRKNIDADYYGFRDEEDGVLLREEAEATKTLRRIKCEAFDERKKRKRADGDDDDDEGREAESNAFVAHVPLPAREQIEALVLEKKKKDLLAKYASEELREQQGDAEAMLNIKKH
jgi:pre-mRNA-splicing factor ISY1